MKLPPYLPPSHLPLVLEIDAGLFATVCGSCSARDGAWIRDCPNWPAVVPALLFAPGFIGEKLEEVMYELVRPYDADEQ